jgi:hypothetical protein
MKITIAVFMTEPPSFEVLMSTLAKAKEAINKL